MVVGKYSPRGGVVVGYDQKDQDPRTLRPPKYSVKFTLGQQSQGFKCVVSSRRHYLFYDIASTRSLFIIQQQISQFENLQLPG